MRYLYVLLNYTDSNGNSIAFYERVATNQNLFNHFEKSIQNYITGDVALLNIIHVCDSKKIAIDSCDDWNNIYKKENRFFRLF